MDDLKHINKLYDDITYISYFTVKPSDNSIQKYLKKLSKYFLKNSNKKAKLIGHKTRNINPNKIPEQIKLYSKIEDLVKDL